MKSLPFLAASAVIFSCTLACSNGSVSSDSTAKKISDHSPQQENMNVTCELSISFKNENGSTVFDIDQDLKSTNKSVIVNSYIEKDVKEGELSDFNYKISLAPQELGSDAPRTGTYDLIITLGFAEFKGTTSAKVNIEDKTTTSLNFGNIPAGFTSSDEEEVSKAISANCYSNF